jgi:rhodanese-related sulfurtransferase
MYKNIDKEAFKAGIQEPNAVIIDVRTYGETMEGMIPGSLHIDIMGGTLMDEVQKMDKSKSYYLYCRSGNRSGAACGAMANMGFNKVYNLVGGTMAWDGKVVLPN